MNTLLLTATERPWFDRLSEELKDGWVVQEETLDAYETDEALRIRSHMARFDSYPQLKDMIAAVRSGKPTKEWNVDGVPEELLPTVFFTIGARGIAAMMSALLTQLRSDEDIRGLASLSAIRHDLLAANASTPPVSSHGN